MHLINFVFTAYRSTPKQHVRDARTGSPNIETVLPKVELVCVGADDQQYPPHSDTPLANTWSRAYQ